MKSHSTTSQVELMAVKSLLGKRYHIPSYQRGYRWTKKQVTQLLDDFQEFYNKEGEAFYCLQPIVIVPLYGEQRPICWQDKDDPVYEVVDGQQRLTTLLLILQYLKDYNLPLNELYQMSYETREESFSFISDIKTKSEDQAECNSDYWHIYHAYKTIEEWFSDKIEWMWPIFQLLLSGNDKKNVRIIWYELGQSEDKISAFSRLNIGKIPLTNAELIKALFLRRGNFAESLATLEQVQLASEWDSIEHKLQAPSFWTFASGGTTDGYPNRIELIFDLIAEGRQAGYTSFDYYTQVLNAPDVRISEIWLNVKQVFLRLEEWYHNHELYHYVGYLTSTGTSVRELYHLSLGKSKASFVQALKEKIKEGLKNASLDELEYEPKYLAMIRKVLLLFNIETILSSSKADTRFPFEIYLSGQWDVEHIRSQTEYGHKGHQEEVLKGCIDYFASKPQPSDLEQELLGKIKALLDRMLDKQKGDAYQQDFNELFAQIQKHFGEDKDLQATHGLGNLTLLDSKTNRSYGNSPFVLKRRRVIDNDKNGVFVPIATKNVFLKYYSLHTTDMLVWGEEDAKNYMQAIQDVLQDYFPNEQPK